MMIRKGLLGIRQKIVFGFYLLLMLMVGFMFFAILIVRQIERRTAVLHTFEEVLNTTLEMRRYEKNYFLYAQEEDFAENLDYVGRLSEIYERSEEEMSHVLPMGEIHSAVADIRRYGTLMRRLHDTVVHGEKDAAVLSREKQAEELRRQGKTLTAFAEKVGQAERRFIRDLLRTTQRLLVAGVAVVIFCAVSIATVLGRGVVSSLKILEEYTNQVARGSFVAVPERQVDKEIASLFTAFRKMTNILEVRQRQIVQSEKLASLGTLIAGVAHELNNPLSNISTSAQILKEEMTGEESEFRRELIGQIEDQSDRARDIVRTLLEFSRIREMRRELLPFARVVEETLMMLRGRIPPRVAIEVEVAADVHVFVDKQKIQQVLLNLLKNAADVVGDAGHIWIAASKVERPGMPAMAEIMVEDDGPGIPAALTARIFDPFFTTKEVGHGSGLGLFVAHDIVERHGGSITVDSREGEGSTFIVWLPCSEEGT